MNACPDCGHPKAQHTPLVGCLHDGDDICTCERSFKEDKTPERMAAERDAALAQVETGTDADWEAKAVAAIRTLQERESFTPDDVWILLEEQRVPAPREPRALGPILKRLIRAGDIRAVGFTESRRRHGAPVRIYEARQG